MRTMLDTFNSSYWTHDMDNTANRRFVATFQKDFGRHPSLYAAPGYDAAPPGATARASRRRRPVSVLFSPRLGARGSSCDRHNIRKHRQVAWQVSSPERAADTGVWRCYPGI